MSKTMLHELLAVEQSLAETANKVTAETTKTLSQKQSLFTGLTKSHTIFNENAQHLVQATEVKEVESTVDEQLGFLNNDLAHYWDCILQKEEANQRATGDIIIDGITIATNVPSIVLLGMEKKLSTLLGTYNSIPTLDAATAWETDPSYAKKGVFRTKHTIENMHTITTTKFVEASPATKEFKAQIVEQSAIDTIGKYVRTNFSGAITSYDKAERIQRLTALIRAVKKARQRANSIEVNTSLSFGKELLSYIKG